jgi:BNR repeat-like domain
VPDSRASFGFCQADPIAITSMPIATTSVRSHIMPRQVWDALTSQSGGGRLRKNRFLRNSLRLHVPSVEETARGKGKVEGSHFERRPTKHIQPRGWHVKFKYAKPLFPAAVAVAVLFASVLAPARLINTKNVSVVYGYPGSWQSVGGSLASEPAVSSWGSHRLDVFALGQDKNFYRVSSTDSGATWSGFNKIVANGASGPSAFSPGVGMIGIVARGQDLAYYFNSSGDSGATWSGWSRIAATGTSSPALTSSATGRLDLFARGQDNAFYQASSSNGGATWTAWTRIPSNATSDPAAVSRGAGMIDLVGRGTDNAIYLNQSTNSGATWSGWSRLPALAATGPAISSTGAAELDVWAVGQDSLVYQNKSTNGGTTWSGWTAHGGQTMSSKPGAINAFPGGTTTEVLDRGVDLKLYHQSI